MQHDQACGNPILIRISSRAGHGMGKPLLKRIAELADSLRVPGEEFGHEAAVGRDFGISGFRDLGPEVASNCDCGALNRADPADPEVPQQLRLWSAKSLNP